MSAEDAAMSERQLLASIAFNICNGGGGAGGLTFTHGNGAPPIDGSITNDWTGCEMTKDEAKQYVMDYRVGG